MISSRLRRICSINSPINKMIIQIFGTKKCKTSQKAVRFFKERRINYQFIDLKEKNISKGELQNIKASIDIHDLINTESRDYTKKNLKYLSFDIEEKILDNPLLIKTPIIRRGKQAAVGLNQEFWMSLVHSKQKNRKTKKYLDRFMPEVK